MTDLYLNTNPKMLAKFIPLAKSGCRQFAFQGGRRSGKTFFISQTLMQRGMRGEIINMASMTSEQGRLGVYSDCKTIIGGSPSIAQYVETYSSPREIRMPEYGGRMFFNSYQDPERAKGIACDWLFINEANNFTLQQYTDLMASVRKGVFIDFNPNEHFWVDDIFQPESIIHSTWQDNREYLSPLQIKYFEDLKTRAFAPDATEMDVYLYNVYYLGQYAEMGGDIFNASNIHTIDAGDLPNDLTKFRVMCDPSALMDSDYFACVFAAYSPSTKMIYILDTLSVNRGVYDSVADIVLQWAGSRDAVKVYVETNGLVGINFYNFMREQRGYRPQEIHNTVNKFNRICANYHNITDKVLFVANERLKDYLRQIYTFGKKCEHDDNVDAVSSVVDLILKY